VRQGQCDFARRLDEVDTVIVVFFQPGRDSEDIRIEDDIFGREADLVDQDVISALADFGLARERIGLADLVERHHHDGGAIAARNQLIGQRQALFDEANLPLSIIDIPEMAQRNIAALLEPEGRGLALLSFDAEGGLLTISFSGELYLARRIDVSSSQLAQADADARSALFDRITLELQRSLDHFDRQYHFITVSRLVLAPMEESGLQEYLSTNLYIPVENLNLEAVLDLSKYPELKSPAAQQRYFLTLGAALRHEEKTL